jgi:hypothetical protein
MTLKENFLRYTPVEFEYEYAEKCEKIADEFAIGFAEWRLTTFIKNVDEYTMEELLSIYKQEKGL